MINFIRDDFTEKDKLELEKVTKIINSKPKRYEAKAVFLRNFVDALVVSAARVTKSTNVSSLKTKFELENRKQKIVKRLNELQPKEEKPDTPAEKIMKLTKFKDIKEIVCDGPEMKIKVLHKGGYNEETEMMFKDLKELNEFIVILGQKANVHVSPSRPFINSIVEEKYHVQATYGAEFFKPKFVIHIFS